MNNISIPNILRQMPKLVGDRPNPRWWRASLTLRGSDGESRETFFNEAVERRVGSLHQRIITRAPWKPLLQIDIPKAHAAEETRPICWATIEDTALLYLLADALVAHAETVLTETCIAYRPHRAIDRSIRRAIQTIRRRGLHCVCVIDIKSFYDSIPWKRLDAVIDGLPADADVKTLLKQLVRIRVLRTDGSVVDRRAGIAQGLQISPVLANLVLAAFDSKVQKTLARWGVMVLRYADDFLVAAADMKTLERARAFASSQLGWEGFQTKAGTGECVDLRMAGAKVRWLGIELSTADVGGERGLVLGVPDSLVQEKADDLLGELEVGAVTIEEVDARLYGLERFYGAILSETTTKQIIRSIRERVLPTQGETPLQAVRVWMDRLGLGEDRKKEVKTRNIEQVIHRARPVRKNHTPPRERELDDGLRNPDLPSLLHLSGVGESVGIALDRGLLCSSSLAGPGQGERTKGDSGGNTEGLSDGTAGRTPGARPVDGFMLSPPGGLRPDNPTGRDGVPASSHPSRFSESGRVFVRAEARGPRAVHVDIVGAATWSGTLSVPDSRSTAEAVLAGFEQVVKRLAADGHKDIMLTTTEAAVHGYVDWGWRVGSARVLRRLRALQADVRARVVFQRLNCLGGV